MNRLLAALLATVAGTTIAAAPAFAQNDAAGYRTAMQKVEADHKAAKQKCDALKDEDICEEQADVARAKAELAAVTKYDNTASNREAARRKLADAEYELAEEKCDTMKGNAKDSCMNNAKSVRTAALAAAGGSADSKADSKAGSTGGSGATAATAAGSAGLVASTDTKDPVKSAAVEKCEEKGNKTACLVENKDKPDTALERAGEKTRAAAATAVAKTKEAASKVADKTREVTSGAAERTERAAENVGDKTRSTASTAADKTEKATERAGSRTTAAMSDTAITAKVKAGLAAAPDTSALAVKVETEKGVVMLSGFVDSKAEAERAEQVAKGVEGVTKVKSAIKVK
ncbi:BON domain-containing protein [Massilia sp. IC2-477]|uniref:BON domain-containing protein n=1 Tax=Massilia sp. IC2-477 TaxID=2887198 RepID=UPI001D124F02|nr:BON domain-containing protein [Massilia sp. IC2-477]MCC2957155.1 BON domain-containing protein [Massilia sp. IC2-477]